MRRFVIVGLLLVACGGESESTAPTESESPSESESESESRGESESESATTTTSADPALCDRVGPCAQAFAGIAPSSLAAPALVAAEQLDHTLVESPARAAACRDALASFRADLERLSLEVPEACRESAP